MKTARPAAFALLLVFLLCLGSCGILDILFASYFPPTLSQAVAQKDFSSDIPEDAGEYYILSVETAGSPPSDYVLLFSQELFEGPHMMALDSDLEIVQREDDLPSDFNGRWTMTDASGKIIMGNAVLDPESVGSGFSITTMATLFSPSVSISTTLGNFNVINIRIVDGRELIFDLFDDVWDAYAVNPQDIDSEGYFAIVCAYADHGSSVVRLLLSEKNSHTTYCVSIPFDVIDTGFVPNLPDVILSEYPPVMSLPSILKWEDCGFIDGLLIVYDDEADEYSVYDLSTGDVRKTLHDPTTRDRKITVYSRTGSYFYTFDARKRNITKYKAWWRE
jgi:hypothetical protein